MAAGPSRPSIEGQLLLSSLEEEDAQQGAKVDIHVSSHDVKTAPTTTDDRGGVAAKAEKNVKQRPKTHDTTLGGRARSTFGGAAAAARVKSVGHEYQPLPVRIGFRSMIFPKHTRPPRGLSMRGSRANVNDVRDEPSLYALCRLWHNGNRPMIKGRGLTFKHLAGADDDDDDDGTVTAATATATTVVEGEEGAVERGQEAGVIPVKEEQTTDAGAPTTNDASAIREEDDAIVRHPAENGDVAVKRPKVEAEENQQIPTAEPARYGTAEEPPEADSAQTVTHDEDENAKSVAALLYEHQKVWKRKRRAEGDAWRAEIAKTKFKVFGSASNFAEMICRGDAHDS